MLNENEENIRYIKNVECYDSDGNIVFIAVPTKTGMDGEAVRAVRKQFPSFEIISISDGDAAHIGEMNKRQIDFVEKGVALSDTPLYWIDFEW